MGPHRFTDSSPYLSFISPGSVGAACGGLAEAGEELFRLGEAGMWRGVVGLREL